MRLVTSVQVALLLAVTAAVGYGLGSAKVCSPLRHEMTRIENVAEFAALAGGDDAWEPGQREEYDGRYAALLKLGTEAGCL